MEVGEGKKVRVQMRTHKIAIDRSRKNRWNETLVSALQVEWRRGNRPHVVIGKRYRERFDTRLLQKSLELVLRHRWTRSDHCVISTDETEKQRTHQVQVVASEKVYRRENMLIVRVGGELKIRLHGLTDKLVVAYELLVLWIGEKGAEVCFVQRMGSGHKQVRRDAQLDVHVERVDLETQQAGSKDDER